MSRSFSLLSIAAIGSMLAACSVAARVPFVGAVGSSTSPQELAASGDEEVIDGAAADSIGCEQELGRDTGGIVEKAGLIQFGAIEGCVTNEDDADGFLVHIDDDMSLSIKFKLLNEHGSVHVEVYDVDGGKLGSMSTESFESKRLRLAVEADTDLFIRIKGYSYGDEKNGRYKLIVGPDKKVARK